MKVREGGRLCEYIGRITLHSSLEEVKIGRTRGLFNRKSIPQSRVFWGEAALRLELPSKQWNVKCRCFNRVHVVWRIIDVNV